MTRRLNRKPRPGERVKHNRHQQDLFIETAQRADYLQRILAGTGKHQNNPSTISLRNDSGADITVPRPILAIGAPLFDPSEDDNKSALRRPTFKGLAIDHEDANKYHFAICQGPIRENGATTGAIISGLSWVKINVTADTEQFHWYAEPDNEERMILVGAGTARVLWKEDGTGEVWGLVNIGDFAAPTFLAKTSGAHNKGVTQAVDIYGPAIPDDTTKGSEVTQSFQVDSYNRYADLGDAVWVEIQWRRNGWELINGEC